MAAAGKLGIISKVENTQNREEIEITTHKWCASGKQCCQEMCIFEHCPNSILFILPSSLVCVQSVWSVMQIMQNAQMREKEKTGKQTKACKNRQKQVGLGKNRYKQINHGYKQI